MFKSLDLVATLTFIIFQNQVWLRLMQQTWSAQLPDLEVKLLSMEQSGGVVVKSIDFILLSHSTRFALMYEWFCF